MKRDPVQAKGGISRRHFLAASGWLALGATTLGRPMVTEAARFNGELFRVSTGRTAMGTFVNTIVFHPSKEQGQEAIEKAYHEMDRLVGILSCHDASTPLSFLNQSGVLRDVAPELTEVMTASLQFHQGSKGAFDITIKPVLDLYEQNFRKEGKPPTEDQIAALLPYVDCSHVNLEQGKISFNREGMKVTLDGIAKGYIVDRSMEVLRSAGIRHALINAGGDICVMGSKGDGSPWSIAIQDPWNPDKSEETIQMTRGSVATSGNYEVYFDKEKQYHHLIAPPAGLPANLTASVSIVAPTTMMADALSTSVFILGPDEGRALLRSTPQVRGLILSSDHQRSPVNWKKTV